MELPSEYLVTFYKIEEGEGQWNVSSGKYEPGTPSKVPRQGIVLPLSTDDLKFSDGGTYTVHDRKVYTDLKLETGTEIEYDEVNYTIRAEKDYSHQADIYIYFVKRVSQ